MDFVIEYEDGQRTHIQMSSPEKAIEDFKVRVKKDYRVREGHLHDGKNPIYVNPKRLLMQTWVEIANVDNLSE